MNAGSKMSRAGDLGERPFGGGGALLVIWSVPTGKFEHRGGILLFLWAITSSLILPRLQELWAARQLVLKGLD